MSSNSTSLHPHSVTTRFIQGGPAIPSHHESTAFTSESISTKGKPKIRRLNREGSKILQDVFDSGNTNPHAGEKQQLLDKITAIPGNEDYTLKNLNTWFVNKRATVKKAGNQTQQTTATAPPSTPTSTAPTTTKASQTSHYLKPDKILTLNTLFYQSNTNPPQVIIDTWATLLETESAAVTAWVEAEKAKLKLASTSGQGPEPKLPSAPPLSLDPSRNILTPNSSTSPPPTSTPGFWTEPSIPLSPVDQQHGTPRVESLTSIQSPIHSTGSMFVKVEEDKKPCMIPALPPTTDPIRRDILLAIHHDLSDLQYRHNPYPHPKTREELSALFDSCTRPMEEFLKKVKSGSLEKFGFKRDWA
ncbi:hypothetical protein L218DRAFT_512352 [Marasmius fiardii PR-910]|nr:hypothetical protein L218DRAFT_512352 [Marasmius fiardii PR-910]